MVGIKNILVRIYPMWLIRSLTVSNLHLVGHVLHLPTACLPICLSISCCSLLEHSASVKRFVSLQFLNLRQSVGLFGRGISPTLHVLDKAGYRQACCRTLGEYYTGLSTSLHKGDKLAGDNWALGRSARKCGCFARTTGLSGLVSELEENKADHATHCSVSRIRRRRVDVWNPVQFRQTWLQFNSMK
jgi:hypothetical protein